MTKVKMVTTQATTAVIYNDGTNAIIKLETIGKLNLSKAKKFFKSDYVSKFNDGLTNAKTYEVIEVNHTPITFAIEDEKLYEFLKENGTLETEGENDTTETTVETKDNEVAENE